MKKNKPMGVKELRKMRDKLTTLLGHAEMKNAHFKHAIPGECSDLPKTPDEVTDFIKNRTRLYRQTWLESPIKELLASIESKLQGY